VVSTNSFDGRGIHTRIHEYSTFPEIDLGSVERCKNGNDFFTTDAITKKICSSGSARMPFAKEAANNSLEVCIMPRLNKNIMLKHQTL